MPKSHPDLNGKQRDPARPIAIGIDASLTATAVSCAVPVVGGGPKFFVELFTSESLGRSVCDRTDRYCEMVDLIMQVTDKFPPRVVVIEDYIYGPMTRQNPDDPDGPLIRTVSSSMTGLAELGGVLRVELRSIDGLARNIHEVAPTTLKKFTTGKGRGDKTAMIAAVMERWKVGFATDHEFDAYAISRMAACIAGTLEPEDAAQREAITTVLNRPLRSKRGQKR